MKGDILSGKPLITYLRYNFAINEKNLNALGFDRTFNDEDAKDIVDMARAKNKEILYDIGCRASPSIKQEHFNKF